MVILVPTANYAAPVTFRWLWHRFRWMEFLRNRVIANNVIGCLIPNCTFYSLYSASKSPLESLNRTFDWWYTPTLSNVSVTLEHQVELDRLRECHRLDMVRNQEDLLRNLEARHRVQLVLSLIKKSTSSIELWHFVLSLFARGLLYPMESLFFLGPLP